CRKRCAVANRLHFEHDRNGRIAGPQEITVQRMRTAFLHGATGRDQCLRHDLAAVESAACTLGMDATKKICPEGLEREDLDQVREPWMHAQRACFERLLSSGA